MSWASWSSLLAKHKILRLPMGRTTIGMHHFIGVAYKRPANLQIWHCWANTDIAVKTKATNEVTDDTANAFMVAFPSTSSWA